MNASRLVVIAALVAGGCKGNPAPAPTRDPPPPAASSGVAAPAREAVPDPVPTLHAEPFAPPGTHLIGLFPIEGALAVAEQQRVGRIVGDGVEWLDARMPARVPALGKSVITSVHGKWPDRVDVLYTNDGGRVAAPSYFPLTGKGTAGIFGSAGGHAWIAGIVTSGESTVLAVFTYLGGVGIYTVRGPELRRRLLSPMEAGCKDVGTDWPQVMVPEQRPAIIPERFGGTRGGTLMSVGPRCGHAGAAVEIWDKDGKSRVVDDSPWIKSIAGMVQGRDDDLWLVPGGDGPVVRFQDGRFEPLPSIGKVQVAFLSPDGKLHASDRQAIHRWADGEWTVVARLAFPMSTRTMAILGDTFWAATEQGEIYRLRKGESVDIHDGCATPFVYLYDVSRDNAKDFTFPATRKALSTFPEADDIGLVEFQEGGRRLGVTVKSRAQGEALVAHVKATMPKETPRLVCHSPGDPRRIELKPPRR